MVEKVTVREEVGVWSTLPTMIKSRVVVAAARYILTNAHCHNSQAKACCSLGLLQSLPCSCS